MRCTFLDFLDRKRQKYSVKLDVKRKTYENTFLDVIGSAKRQSFEMYMFLNLNY